MTSTSDPATRTSVLGGHHRPRRLFGSVSLPQLVLLAAAGLVGVILLVLSRSLLVLGVEALLAGGLRWVWRRRTGDEQPWLQAGLDTVRAAVAARTGADCYNPPAEASPRPVPRELGRVRFATASAAEGEPELAVVDHLDEGELSTVIEISGGGDGLRELRAINRDGVQFGQFLYGLAGPDLPVTQVDVSTRVLPAPVGLYQQWIDEHLAPDTPELLAANLRELAELGAAGGETYRSWLTVRCSRDGLAQQVARQGLKPSPERLAEQALHTTSDVARLAAEAGFEIRAGLGPRRLGALVRHLYAPHYDPDELAGITGPRDGFQPYTARHQRTGVCVPDADQPWWHATASIARDGWPLHPVGMRWLEALVTNIQPATVRTVTAQFQLTSQHTARADAALAHTLDQAEVRDDQRSGRVSTGVNEAQAAASARVLDDLVEHAAGCRPTVRVTVSAPTPGELAEARRRVHTAATGDGNVQRLTWHDTRHHHAHLLTLPLGKGLAGKGTR